MDVGDGQKDRVAGLVADRVAGLGADLAGDLAADRGCWSGVGDRVGGWCQ